VRKHSAAVRLAPTLPVSKRRNKRPTGKAPPASRPCTMGQRPHPMVYMLPTDDQGWTLRPSSPKEVSGKPEIPAVQSGFRKERLGSGRSHHLRASVEYIVVNVGGSHMEMSSPSMKYASVGGIIVLGGRESRPQEEGRQLVGISTQNNRMLTQGNP
jgi:hypothetical protein